MVWQNRRTYINIGLVGLGLVLVYLLAAVVVPRVLVTFTKAAPATKVSVQNSYFLGNKILAAADGKEACVVNIFVLDETGKGIKGKGIELSGVGEPQTEMSGADGKATFEIRSVKEGQFTLTASIEGVPMDKTVKVTFRN